MRTSTSTGTGSTTAGGRPTTRGHGPATPRLTASDIQESHVNGTTWLYAHIEPNDTIAFVNTEQRNIDQFNSLEFVLFWNCSKESDMTLKVRVAEHVINREDLNKVVGYKVPVKENVRNRIIIPLADFNCKAISFVSIERMDCACAAENIVINNLKLSCKEANLTEESRPACCCPNDDACVSQPNCVQNNDCIEPVQATCCCPNEVGCVNATNCVANTNCRVARPTCCCPNQVDCVSEPDCVQNTECIEPVRATCCCPNEVGCVNATNCVANTNCQVERSPCCCPTQVDCVSTPNCVQNNHCVTVSSASDPLPDPAVSVVARSVGAISEDTLDDVEFVCQDGAFGLAVLLGTALLALL